MGLGCQANKRVCWAFPVPYRIFSSPPGEPHSWKRTHASTRQPNQAPDIAGRIRLRSLCKYSQRRQAAARARQTVEDSRDKLLSLKATTARRSGFRQHKIRGIRLSNTNEYACRFPPSQQTHIMRADPAQPHSPTPPPLTIFMEWCSLSWWELWQEATEADDKVVAVERSGGQRRDTEDDHLVRSEPRGTRLRFWLPNTERPSLLCGPPKHAVLQHGTTFPLLTCQHLQHGRYTVQVWSFNAVL